MTNKRVARIVASACIVIWAYGIYQVWGLFLGSGIALLLLF